MEPTDGSHVTWRELNLALKPVNDKLDWLLDRAREEEDAAWFGRRGRNAWQNIVTGGTIAAIAAMVSLLAHFAL